MLRIEVFLIDQIVLKQEKNLIKDFEDLSYIYFFVVFFVIMYILTKARKLSMIVKMYELQNMCFSFSWQ